MRFVVKVEVGLKPGHSDPEGETTMESLVELGYQIETVKVSKSYELLLVASSLREAEKQVEEICRRLLANPVKDNYEVQIEEVE